ncbi:hypothetical protein HON22_06055 [Candidatus Peregrinibacteria bacterium]|jgi:hypothetical protein|nr:hypothetical protein [Candidatus Peregrinibacteria bacterium]
MPLSSRSTTIRRFPRKSEVLFTSVVAIIVLIFCGLSLTYLSHANAVATKGYQIKQMQEERNKLQADLDVWNLKLVRLQALQNIASSSYVAQMEGYTERPLFIETTSEVAIVY